MPSGFVNPDTVAPTSGGYSHAVAVAPGTRWLYVSGQVPERPDGTFPTGFRAQCDAVWDNVEAILAAAGMGVTDLIKVTTFLTDAGQAAENGEVRRRRLGGHAPALAVIVAQTLESDWLLEIEAVAAANP